MIYIYKDIFLRAIEENDLELLKEMINDPLIEIMTGGYSYPVSSLQQRIWYENVLVDNDDLRLIIETKNDGAVGIVMLTNIDWKNRTAEFHSKIKTTGNLRGKGLGTMATTAIVKYGFDHLNLKLIYSTIIEYNNASQRVKEKCGFVKDGVLRNRIFKNGEYHNVTIWSIQTGELIES